MTEFPLRSLTCSMVLLLIAGCNNVGPLSADPAGSGRSPANRGDYTVQTTMPLPKPVDPENEWCVVLEDGEDPAAFALEHGLTLLRTVPSSNLSLFYGDVELGDILLDDAVATAEENASLVLSMPVDLTLGFSQGEWSLGAVNGQVALAGLQLGLVHTAATGEGIRVGVLDTGVVPDHPHLAGRVDLLPPGSPLGSLETPNGIDDDDNGEIDDAYGHGTHVAGTVLTVAPDCRVLAVRVLNEEGWGTVFDLATGMALALEQQVDIVNLSLAMTGVSELIENLLDELNAAGIVVVAAAGNTPNVVAFPASHVDVLSVAAQDSTGGLAAFSGAYAADVAAPGEKIASSFPPNLLALGTGTSMACAVASGCIAALAGSPGLETGAPEGETALCANAPELAPPGAVIHGRVAPWKVVANLGFPVLAPISH